MNTNVAVYPVDARGLLGLPFADASKTVKVGKDGRHRWRDPESNSAVTYTLGYYASEDNWDNSFARSK